jgi:DNA-binding response OmpR family regulator
VVDDDDSIRLMVERVLRREGYAVDGARDGFEAIEKLACNDYETILLDLMMPRVDGLGVLEYLERNRPELGLSVILMTANLPGAVEAKRQGIVSAILSKPFDLGDLLAQVRGSEIANRH